VTPTEIQLLAIHRGPVPLEAICETYLGMSREVAYQRAALNRLPFPTFRLGASQKAKLVVAASDLAAHIDEQHRCAKEAWVTSQV
jgi:hypothetical protein